VSASRWRHYSASPDDACASEHLDKRERFALIFSVVKVRDMLKRLAADGWVIVRRRGSHRQLQHATKRSTVTVQGQPSQTLKAGAYKRSFAQAGLEDRR